MVDLGKESDLWRGHGIIIGEEKLETEDSTYEGSRLVTILEYRSARVGVSER